MSRCVVPLGALAFVLVCLPVTAEGPKEASLTKSPFGKTADETPIDLYTLTNKSGMVAKVMTYGGILTELHVPDKKGKTADVVLGFDDLKGYLSGHPYFGSNVGRVANRVAGGKFTLDGKTYTLEKNNGPNALHGGKKGFDKVVWQAEKAMGPGGVPRLQLKYTSPDGEEGYPGTLKATVLYTLTDKNELRIDYEATTDKATPVNLAHHSYFNLAGHDSGDILGHLVMLEAEKYTPTDATLIPTGKIEPVAGTPLDFTKPTVIGQRIKELKGDPVGYDHNFVLRRCDGKGPCQAAKVRDPKTGRVMDVLTTEPGIQFYTGNFLDGTNKGKGGAVYKQYAGFCLEAQHFPDSVNKPDFPSVILKPGETYHQTTVYAFSAE
jgi:aldose 1-epimerase